METGQNSPPLAVGTRVDAYQIADVMEQGRYSTTYLGRDAAGAEVLIKEFLPHEFAVRDGETVRARDAEDKTPLRFWLRSFLDKAVLLQKLNHPGLVRVLRQFEANGTGYYVTERIPGQSLAEILERDGTLAEPQLRRLLAPLLSGLEQAHAVGLLHRDIRPENIMVRGDDSAVLTGFGVLRAPIRFKARTVFSAGAPPYAAPEEFFMAGPHGPWTDLYGLGGTLWRAVTATAPPDARSRGTGPALPPVAMHAKVRLSEALAAAIDEALRLPAEQRPQSIAQWRASLQGETLPGAEAAAAAAAASETVYAATPPRRSALPLLAGVGVAAAAVVGGYFMMHSGPQQPEQAVAATAPAAAPAPVQSAPVAAAAAPAPAQATAAAAEGANLDQLAQELMAKEKKLAEVRDQLQQAQHEQAALEAKTAAPAKAAAAPQQQPQQAAAAPAAAPAEDERLKQLQAEVERLRKEKDAQQAATVASAAPVARSGPGPEWNAWYRDALGSVRQSLRYPQKSLQGGEEGDVMVKVLLRRDGSIVKTELTERTPYSALNGEALAVFSRVGRFAPVPADYSPGNAQVEMSMPINFKIAADQ